MSTQNDNAKVIYQVLYTALLEIREHGRDLDDGSVFHLADLFHNIVLQLIPNESKKIDYQLILEQLADTAKRGKYDAWLSSTMNKYRNNDTS